MHLFHLRFVAYKCSFKTCKQFRSRDLKHRSQLFVLLHGFCRLLLTVFAGRTAYHKEVLAISISNRKEVLVPAEF